MTVHLADTGTTNEKDNGPGSRAFSVIAIFISVLALLVSIANAVIEYKSYQMAKDQRAARDSDSVSWLGLVSGAPGNPLNGNAIQIYNRSHTVIQSVAVASVPNSSYSKKNLGVSFSVNDDTVYGLSEFWIAEDIPSCTVVTLPNLDDKETLAAIGFVQDNTYWLLFEAANPIDCGDPYPSFVGNQIDTSKTPGVNGIQSPLQGC